MGPIHDVPVSLHDLDTMSLYAKELFLLSSFFCSFSFSLDFSTDSTGR